jgi:hypothetical protein
VLVFDSLDSLGDQYSLGNLEVIYAPRNNFSKTADEKIIEIFTQWKLASSKKDEIPSYSLNIIKKLVKDDLTFVSDDQDLITKVAAIKSGIGENIRIIGNDQFIAQLEKKTAETTGPELDRGLSGDEVEKINDELLSIWKEVK